MPYNERDSVMELPHLLPVDADNLSMLWSCAKLIPLREPLSFFLIHYRKARMQQAQKQLHFQIELTLEGGKKKMVDVRAADPSVAEHRALKRNPAAVSAKAVNPRKVRN